jgi:NAD(P) transhydrogenase subunit alpha
MELLPRISRAQSSDVLSSQANIAGYKAVLLAASELDRYFPMLMTAAGTVQPAKVVVLGGGVAGLQAVLQKGLELLFSCQILGQL